MKKLIALLMAATMTLSLCACGSGNTPQNEPITEPNPETIQSPAVEETPEEKKATVGDTVATELFECTLTRAEFAPAVSNVMDENYFLPDENFWPDNPYVADKDSVYLSFVFELSYLGSKEIDFELGKVESKDLDWMNFLAKFDNTYEFESFSITGSVDGTWDSPYNISGGYMSSLSNQAFSFKPLEEGSHEFRGYVQMSNKVLEDDGKPVDLIITLCDEEIVYSIK